MSFSGLGFFFTSLVLVSLTTFGQVPSSSPSPTSSPSLSSSPSPSSSPANARISKIFELFYVTDDFRTPYDRIDINGSQITLSIWRTLPPQPEAAKIECTGYQWLLTGRGKKIGEGAPQVFAEFPEVQKITLKFVEIEFQSKGKDGRGRMEKVPVEKPYLVMSMTRPESALPKARSLKASLQKNQQECLKIGRSLIKEKEIKL